MDVSKLFNSKARKEILKLYFADPDGEYYLRELEKILKIPVSIVRREMLRLKRDGLFSVRRLAKSTFYALNKDYLFYNEIQSMVSKAAGKKKARMPKEKELAVRIKDPAILLIYLFGSQVKGKVHTHSDADIGVLLDGKVNEAKYIDYQLMLVGKFKDYFGKSEIVVTIMNNAPILLQYEIIQHGRIIYKKDTRTKSDFELRLMRRYFDTEYQRRVNNVYLFNHIKEGYYGSRSEKYLGTFK